MENGVNRICKTRFQIVVEKIQKLLLEKQESILIGIDGRCGSGKTTLADYLQDIFLCNVFHMDDFFLQDYQRTQERLSEIGGNVDYERFTEEVLFPLQSKKTVHYRKFSCIDYKFLEAKNISFKKCNIIEGSYSMHPYFKNPYDLRIFMNIRREEQLENILKRNGKEKLKLFQERWIPMEERYFQKYQILEKSDMIIDWKK